MSALTVNESSIRPDADIPSFLLREKAREHFDRLKDLSEVTPPEPPAPTTELEPK